jgi:drug/metabolite transporter (DMT)-like permease
MLLALFFILAFLWGGSFIAIKIVVATVPPFWAAAVRLLSALVFLYVLLKLMKKNLYVEKSVRLKVFLSSMFSQGIPFALLFWGERSISPGLGGILNGSTPIWTFVFGLILMPKQEPFTLTKLIGLVFGVAGLFCIFGPKLAAGFGDSSTLGAIMVGLMGLSYGIGNICNRFVMIDPQSPTLEGSLFLQTFISTFFLLLLAVVFEGSPKISWFRNSEFIWATLYMGWLSTALAFLIYYKLLRDWGALKGSSVAYLIPLAAVLLDFFINKNVPTLSDLVGTGVILVGVLMLQGRINFSRLRAYPK